MSLLPRSKANGHFRRGRGIRERQIDARRKSDTCKLWRLPAIELYVTIVYAKTEIWFVSYECNMCATEIMDLHMA